MSFKFELRQRVTLPGKAGGIQAQVVGRGEDLIFEPQYRLAWTEGVMRSERCFPESEIVLANTERNEPQTEVISVKVGQSLIRPASSSKQPRRKR